jgi:hypothetical protein
MYSVLCRLIRGLNSVVTKSSRAGVQVQGRATCISVFQPADLLISGYISKYSKDLLSVSHCQFSRALVLYVLELLTYLLACPSAWAVFVRQSLLKTLSVE